MGSENNEICQTLERSRDIFTIMSIRDVLQITTRISGFYKVLITYMFWFSQYFNF